MLGKPSDPQLKLQGWGITLRPPQWRDYPSWKHTRTQSKSYFEPWEPTWAKDATCKSAFRKRLEVLKEWRRRELGIGLFIISDDGQEVIGGLNLDNIRRSVAQSAKLGYWVGSAHSGKGIMTASVIAVCEYAFSKLDLHRVEAACLPENKASIRVLEKSGFGREGVAKSYLKINGRWQDHLLFANVNPKQTSEWRS